MKSNKKIFLFFFLLLLLIFGFSFFYPKLNNPFYDYKKTIIDLKGEKFVLLVADDQEKRAKGLSKIKDINENYGMIFIFNQPGYYYFWMKEMNFPLDFVFIKDKKIVDIIENVYPASYPQTFTSKKPADKVIEFKTGTTKSLKIKIGDKIRIEP